MRALVLLLVLIAVPAGAQTITIGPEFPAGLNSGVGAVTVIDISSPIAADGVIDTVRYKLDSPCPVKIKFFRRSANTFTMIAERGPFTVAPDGEGTSTITLSPPVTLVRGDLIAYGVPDGSCALLLAHCPAPAPGMVAFSTDITGSVVAAAEDFGACTVALRGTGTTTAATELILRGVIPVAGSAPGNNGAFFRTSLQLSLPLEATAPVSGRLVYHPAGREGSAADPAVPFTLQPGEVRSWYDFVQELGLSGVGSIDLEMPSDSTQPIVSVRVFNDAGAAGTSGMSVPTVIYSTDVIFGRQVGYVVTPLDPVKTRFNIGVRSLDATAVTFTLLDAFGNAVASTTRDYARHSFEQVSAESMFGPLPANRLIRISSTGQVIVYGATVDNKTNDPALQLATISSMF